MPDTLNAAELRRMAMECGTLAHEPGCRPAERDRYLKMQQSLLALAESADWLAGRTPTDIASRSIAS